MPGSRRRPSCRGRHRPAAADLCRLERSAAGMGAAAVGQRARGAGRGSTQGLEDLAAGRAVLAGCHLLDPETDEWNLAAVKAHLPGGRHVLIHWARRTQGLMTAAGNPLGITGLATPPRAACASPLRAEGAGSQRLLDVLLAREGLAPPTSNTSSARRDPCRPRRPDRDGRGRLRPRPAGRGRASGLPAAGLGRELRSRDGAPRLFRAAGAGAAGLRPDRAFARRAAHLGGYDLSDLGEVLWNG
jgi:putative molybdopterin biosynthesis protein